MSVNLQSKDGTIDDGMCNGNWAAIVALARAYDSTIPAWNGCHDGYEWTPEHLNVMADRLEQTAQFIPLLRDLANGGGVIIT